MLRKTLVVVLCAIVFSACATIPASLKLNPQDRSLAKKVNQFIQKAGCRLGVAAIDLQNERTLAWNAEETFESASVIKIAILAEALSRWQEGRLDLQERWSLSNEAKAAGSGVLDAFDAGLQPTNQDLLRLMIIVSDNTATNHWIDIFGFEAINKRMESASLPQIRLLGKKIPEMNPPETEEERWKGFKLGEVTPLAVANYYRLLFEGKLLGPEATKLARSFFSQQRYVGRIPRLLLENPENSWEGKTGTLNGSILDSGIITTSKGSYALAIFADQIPDTQKASDKAILTMGDIANEIVTTWEHH